MCVSGYMPQKIRVGRSENLFFFFKSLIDVMIIMHDQGVENNDSLLGLELKLLDISFNPYCASTGQILVTGCNPNDLDIWTDWCRLGLQFVMYKSAEQEWSFIN